MIDFFGIKIAESAFDMVREVPNKRHKKRNNQSARYHARIQKKWLKRFGTHKERYALMLDGAALGLWNGGPRMFCDPKTMVALRGLT